MILMTDKLSHGLGKVRSFKITDYGFHGANWGEVDLIVILHVLRMYP
jgi:hypothetical protein